MKLLVLGGGVSNEREVSLRSAKSIADAARQAGYEVEERDPKDGLDILSSVGAGTIILPILHGEGGEDGTIQARLEELDLPYLGSDSVASTKCWDKWQTLRIISIAGVSVAGSQLVDRRQLNNHPLTAKPYVLKVRRGGSSLGVVIVRDPVKANLKDIDAVFELDESLILEELIEGVEITVAVLGDEALPVVEIQPPAGGEFDYDNKYNGASRELCPPESIDKKTQKRAQDLAAKVHNVLGCRHLSRTDIMVSGDGQLYVIDVNTLPGLTDQSLFPKAAKAAGIDMPALVRRLVDLVQNS